VSIDRSQRGTTGRYSRATIAAAARRPEIDDRDVRQKTRNRFDPDASIGGGAHKVAVPC
jgi:hypothetical protein